MKFLFFFLKHVTLSPVPLINWHSISSFEAKIRITCLQSFHSCSLGSTAGIQSQKHSTPRRRHKNSLHPANPAHWCMRMRLSSTHVHFDPASVSNQASLSGLGEHTPTADRTLWSLNNTQQPTKHSQTNRTTYMISEYSRLRFCPGCLRQRGSCRTVYFFSFAVFSLISPIFSFFFYFPLVIAFDFTDVLRVLMNEKRNMTHRS